jgi:hypothetical protein
MPACKFLKMKTPEQDEVRGTAQETRTRNASRAAATRRINRRGKNAGRLMAEKRRSKVEGSGDVL